MVGQKQIKQLPSQPHLSHLFHAARENLQAQTLTSTAYPLAVLIAGVVAGVR